MKRGKKICKTLKEIRLQVARANDIPYEPTECKHKGDCTGTCPKCEQEVRYIEQQLDVRRMLGKAVAVAGVSAGLAALTACHTHNVLPPNSLAGDVEATTVVTSDGQQSDCKDPNAMVVRTDSLNDNQLVGDIGPMPQFPGGAEKLLEFLRENTRYPEAAVKDSIEGRVVVKFTVEKDGSISNPEVVRSAHPLLDEEALRVVGIMPKWTPGMYFGKPARTKSAVPIIFKMDK